MISGRVAAGKPQRPVDCMGKEIERARDFAERLGGVFDDNLLAVALYGSAARGEYREGESDLNMLVLLRTVDAGRLQAASSLAREWVAGGNPPPLVLSEDEWRESADVFPIEYADIREAHTVLHGPEIFTDVKIEWEDLRLQTERELKEKKIQLRERYLLSADSPRELGLLLRRSFPTFLTLCRASLRLLGAAIPADPEGVITSVASRVGFDPEPWLRVHRARSQGTALEPPPADPLVTGYLNGVARMADWIDRLERGAAPPGV